MNSHDDALNGAPATLFENTSKAGSGGEYAWVQREGSIDATQVWLKAQSSTTQRSSTFVDGWYDFQVTTDKVRLDWAVTMTPLVWWDQSIVRVYNMTTGGILISHNVTGTGVDELVVTPGHNLRLYTGFNQNNLNQWSYPAGNTAFLAEGRLSAPIQAFQGRVTLQDWQGSMVGEPLTVTIRNAANAIVQGPETTTTTTNGSWNLPTSLANGTYKVTVKGRTWLSASVGNVVLSGGSTEVLTTHVNGDSVPDDVIDLSDYTTLILAFNALLDTDPNTAGNQPSPNWNVAADLNGDSAVDLTDYTVIVMNFNAVGG